MTNAAPRLMVEPKTCACAPFVPTQSKLSQDPIWTLEKAQRTKHTKWLPSTRSKKVLKAQNFVSTTLSNTNESRKSPPSIETLPQDRVARPLAHRYRLARDHGLVHEHLALTQQHHAVRRHLIARNYFLKKKKTYLDSLFIGKI